MILSFYRREKKRKEYKVFIVSCRCCSLTDAFNNIPSLTVTPRQNLTQGHRDIPSINPDLFKVQNRQTKIWHVVLHLCKDGSDYSMETKRVLPRKRMLILSTRGQEGSCPERDCSNYPLEAKSSPAKKLRKRWFKLSTRDQEDPA